LLFIVNLRAFFHVLRLVVAEGQGTYRRKIIEALELRPGGRFLTCSSACQLPGHRRGHYLCGCKASRYSCPKGAECFSMLVTGLL